MRSSTIKRTAHTSVNEPARQGGQARVPSLLLGSYLSCSMNSLPPIYMTSIRLHGVPTLDDADSGITRPSGHIHVPSCQVDSPGPGSVARVPQPTTPEHGDAGLLGTP